MFVALPMLAHRGDCFQKELSLKRALTIATAMEMAVLESRDVKKTVSALVSDEDCINQVEKQRVQCYCCGKKGHVAGQCRFQNYKCHSCGKL